MENGANHRLTRVNSRRAAMETEARLESLGLKLPPPVKIPAGVRLPFAFVRVRGNRAYVAGHGPQASDGSIAGPLGKVEAEVTLHDAYGAARLTALSVLGSLKRELGDLDRVTAWLRVLASICTMPGPDETFG